MGTLWASSNGRSWVLLVLVSLENRPFRWRWEGGLQNKPRARISALHPNAPSDDITYLGNVAYFIEPGQQSLPRMKESYFLRRMDGCKVGGTLCMCDDLIVEACNVARVTHGSPAGHFQ